jgi:hypothetical protein
MHTHGSRWSKPLLRAGARVLAVASALAVLLGGCGPKQAPQAADGDRLDPARLYPLAVGNVWSFNVRVTGEELPTLHVQRVVAVQGGVVELEAWSGERERYEVSEAGVYRPAYGAWLLRAPVGVGAEWPSAGGRTARVTSVTERWEGAAGAFEGCVRVEEAGGDARLAMVTLYCPGVGPVYVESSMRADTTGATVQNVGELLGYALETGD